MSIVTIKQSSGEKVQRFWRTQGLSSRSTNIQLQHIIIDHTPSTVAITNDGDVVKLIKARSWHEHVKVLWARSRTHKEVNGARILNNLGMNTADIYEMGISLPIFPHSKYIGYYLMNDIRKNNHIEATHLFKNENTSNDLRRKIIESVCSGLLKLKSINYVFTDFHLANIFSDENGNTIWIDTGITRYSKKKKLEEKFQAACEKFLKYDFYGSLLTETEKEYIMENLKINHDK